MNRYLLRNLALLDATELRLRGGMEVLIDGGRIAAVESGLRAAADVETIDLGGRTVMPGLIDCHVHMASGGVVTHSTLQPSLITARASRFLRELLMSGFTTVRDAGGADAGLREAVEEGEFLGPRLFVSGRAISQTGGHGDFRSGRQTSFGCNCHTPFSNMSRVADGVSQCRQAARDELRMGADQIKIMAGGGVSSPTDSLYNSQYSREELRALVDEATRAGTYCMAHVYMAEGISRAVECGVRTIEHGNFLDEAAAAMMARAEAYLVPTLSVYHADKRQGAAIGLSPATLEKNDEVIAVGARSLDIARRAGVKMAHGTDLSYSPHDHKPDEFVVRSEVLSPAEVIQSATAVGAEVVRLKGKAGVIRAGAFADLLVVDGDPLGDIDLLRHDGRHMSGIMKNGKFAKREFDQQDRI
jgi:imidazolonepropionase-like amidohydrolase